MKIVKTELKVTSSDVLFCPDLPDLQGKTANNREIFCMKNYLTQLLKHLLIKF